MLSVLRDGLAAGPWILGARFSAADVMLGTACHFLRQFKLIDAEPAISGYVERCTARPAFARSIALDVL
jgi:glutathione S-transferase